MKTNPLPFTNYQKLVILLIALIQFTVVLDFLMMAPLGNAMVADLHLSTTQFGYALSAYALSAGVSGSLVAGFADRYSRKTLLLFAYAGFAIGTVLCSIANSFVLLLIARIVAGIFGGIVFAMATTLVADLFAFAQRGQVMSYVQFSFAASQIAGLPAGVFLASRFGWHIPFLMIVVICFPVGIVIWKGLRPIIRMNVMESSPIRHLLNTISQKRYFLPYVTTVLISLPAYMFFPFAAQYLVGNVGITQTELGTVYLVVGIASTIVLPFIGKLSDRLGKWQTFIMGNVLSASLVLVYIHFLFSSLWFVSLITAFMYVGLLARSVPAAALMTAVPTASDRGAFMSINSAMQQTGGGISSLVAGWILTRQGGQIEHFDTVAYICIAAMTSCCIFIYFIYQKIVKREIVQEVNSRLLHVAEAQDQKTAIASKANETMEV